MKTKQSEQSVHFQVCQYLKYQYPNVLFQTDLSGIKLTIGQAVKLKSLRSGRAWPDIFIAEPKDGLHGLYIELKRDGEKLFKRDGFTFVSEHIEEQNQILEKLMDKGYFSCFAIGFDQAKLIIDSYLK